MLKKANMCTIGMQKSTVQTMPKFRVEKMSPHICTRKKSCNDTKSNTGIKSVWRRDSREGKGFTEITGGG